MAENQNINIGVQVNIAQAKQQMDSLQQQIKQLKGAYVNAVTSDTKSTMFQGSITSADDLQKKISMVTKEFNKLNSAMNTSSKPSFESYQTQLHGLNTESMQFYQTWQRTKLESDKLNYINSRTALKELNAQSEAFNRSIGISGEKLGILGQLGLRVKSHFSWLLSGALLGAAFAIPAEVINSITTLEQAMAGMAQVIPGLHEDQKALNVEALKFIDIAAGYGEKAEDIIKVGQSWGRMYKDLSIVNALVKQSATISVADNMSLMEGAKGLEAAMFQYGLVAKDSTEAMAYSGKIIDVWTKLAHYAGTTAQDLTAATERTGSVAKQAGVDFEFLSAMIATATRSTQLGGENIGNMLKSVLGSIHSKKATEEIEALGIATKKVGVDGSVELRKAQDVLLDIAIQAQGTEKNLEDLYKSVSGGEPQLAA